MSERASARGRDDELASASCPQEPFDVAASEREKFCCDEVINNCASEIAGLVGPNDEAQAVEAAVKRALVFMRSLCNLRLAAAFAREKKVEEALRLLHDASSSFYTAASAHFSDTDYDRDGVLSEADAHLLATALPGARSVLENRGQGLAGANQNPLSEGRERS